MGKFLKKYSVTVIIVLTWFGIIWSTQFDTGSKTFSEERLIAGFHKDLFPFNYFDDYGKLQGYDIDLLEEVSKKSGRLLIIKEIKSSQEVSLLKKDKIDLLIGSVLFLPQQEIKSLYLTSANEKPPLRCISLLTKNQTLIEEISEIIREMKASGELQQIEEKWFK